jgi:hypothetical protein
MELKSVIPTPTRILSNVLVVAIIVAIIFRVPKIKQIVTGAA